MFIALEDVFERTLSFISKYKWPILWISPVFLFFAPFLQFCYSLYSLLLCALYSFFYLLTPINSFMVMTYLCVYIWSKVKFIFCTYTATHSRAIHIISVAWLKMMLKNKLSTNFTARIKNIYFEQNVKWYNLWHFEII